MGQAVIRNLDDSVLAALRARAAAHGRALEQELRLVLAQSVGVDPELRVAMAAAIRRRVKPARAAHATRDIRADRDR